MKKIGIISDTHALLDERIYEHFQAVDEVWHAGDWGSVEVANKLLAFKPVRGVYGNIDGQEIRQLFPLHNRFRCEQVDVWLTHIGGYPGRYDAKVRPEIFNHPPQLFVCGHSHILKVQFDKTLNLLHINPGAAGTYGAQPMQTLVRLQINGAKMEHLEVIELGAAQPIL